MFQQQAGVHRTQRNEESGQPAGGWSIQKVCKCACSDTENNAVRILILKI